MNQPNLQAILDGYEERVYIADALSADPNQKEAIDAIYAGLLAVIGEDEPTSDYSPTGHDENRLRASQRQALKRWCYGDKETTE